MTTNVLDIFSFSLNRLIAIYILGTYVRVFPCQKQAGGGAGGLRAKNTKPFLIYQ